MKSKLEEIRRVLADGKLDHWRALDRISKILSPPLSTPVLLIHPFGNKGEPGIHAESTDYTVQYVDGEDGEDLVFELAVACDGKNSWVRRWSANWQAAKVWILVS